jgi:hypothetical protein
VASSPPDRPVVLKRFNGNDLLPTARQSVESWESAGRTGGQTAQLFAPQRKKPFDLLVKGLVLKDSREFRGPIELFLASVAEWDDHVSHLVLTA